MTSHPPQASVVIALRNAADDIPPLLATLAAQRMPRAHFEVIVALAPSDDESASLLETARATGQLDLVVDNPRGLAATGLNAAIRAAGAPFIVRLDARTRPDRDYLLSCLHARRETNAGCVGGAMIPEGRGPIGEAFAAATRGPLGTGGARFRHSPSERGAVDTVYLGAWPRTLLFDVGGFDESLARNQDDELAGRLRLRGERVVLDPMIRSTYRVRESLSGLGQQYFRYGLDKPRAFRGRWRHLALRQLAPAALTLTLSLLGGFALAGPGAAIARGLLGGLLFLHLALGLATTPGRNIVERLLAAPLLLGLHAAYGLGFLLGLPRIWLPPAPRLGLAIEDHGLPGAAEAESKDIRTDSDPRTPPRS